MKFPTKAEVTAQPEGQRLETFRRLANEYQAKHNCRWSEACLAIKRRYGNVAAEAFGLPAEA